MVLEKLGSSLKNTLSKIASSLFVDEKLINELVKDIQRALLQSDVNVKLVFQLTSTIKERIKKEQTPGTLTKKEHLINIVYEELTIFLGKKKNEIKITEKKPFVIMLVGLFGSGKTTTSGKLAKYYTKRGKKVALVGLDIHRPAAMTQLEQIGASINTKTFTSTEKDPIKIYNDYKDELKKYDIVIVDTAGRDALSDDLIQEIKDVTNLINPDETILALSGDIGQAAEKQAKAFHDACNITGVIITKLDGTAKGGGALSACAITNSPVKFIGVGEKPDDLETFNPQGFVGRLLGMGDLEALLEKARDAISKEDAEDLSKKLLKGEFNLLDLYQQMEAMKKMGKIGKLMEMVPGLSSLKIPKDALQVQEEKLKIWKFMMNSLTKEELEDPTIIDNNRIDRISKGSGTKVSDMRDLLKQYKQAKKMVKMLKGNTQNPEQLMKKLGKKQMRVKYK